MTDVDSKAPTRVAGGIPNVCEWERCPEAATHRVRWADGRELADYCDVHTQQARQLGASHVEWFDKPRIGR